jgi:hypothetical protein
MISTKNLLLLPTINHLKALTQSLALLDTILSPDWEYRYWSFNAHWDANQTVASMRNGSGDDLYIMFTPVGAIIKGFAHESVMSPYSQNPSAIWAGVLDDVPEVFSGFLSEPAFSPLDITFCIWRIYNDITWQCGEIAFPESEDPDGSVGLLALLDGNPGTYQTWAEYYYERPVSLSAITHIYQHRPLTQELIAKLNPQVTREELLEDVREIGYPNREIAF